MRIATKRPAAPRTTILALCCVLALTISAGDLLAQGASVRGTVSNASGQVIPSVWVVVEQGGAEKGKSLTGDDGRYYVGSLAHGTYRVIVRRGDQQLYSGTIELPKNAVFDIRL